MFHGKFDSNWCSGFRENVVKSSVFKYVILDMNLSKQNTSNQKIGSAKISSGSGKEVDFTFFFFFFFFAILVTAAILVIRPDPIIQF